MRPLTSKWGLYGSSRSMSLDNSREQNDFASRSVQMGTGHRTDHLKQTWIPRSLTRASSRSNDNLNSNSVSACTMPLRGPVSGSRWSCKATSTTRRYLANLD